MLHFPRMFPLSFRRKTIMLTKKRTIVTKKKLFRLRSLRASDSPFTDPKRVSGGLSNDHGAGCTYAEHAGLHERTRSGRKYLSGAHARYFFV